ncbi:MAG: DUF1922 domain-containing protein [Bacillota bacterium]|uniref:hypothetical protein n=1 Tax=unclassified Candidatus Desulforudis TaxID=2635950 RepID=UPI00347936C9
MQKRTCPMCGRDWYSADTAGTWKCECGAEIKPERKTRKDKDAAECVEQSFALEVKKN